MQLPPKFWRLPKDDRPKCGSGACCVKDRLQGHFYMVRLPCEMTSVKFLYVSVFHMRSSLLRLARCRPLRRKLVVQCAQSSAFHSSVQMRVTDVQNGLARRQDKASGQYELNTDKMGCRYHEFSRQEVFQCMHKRTDNSAIVMIGARMREAARRCLSACIAAGSALIADRDEQPFV